MNHEEPPTKLAASFTVKISAYGRITIPKAIRERLHFWPGTELILEERGETLFMKAAARRNPKFQTGVLP